MKYVPVLELFQLSKISVQYGVEPFKVCCTNVRTFFTVCRGDLIISFILIVIINAQFSVFCSKALSTFTRGRTNQTMMTTPG